MTDKTELQQKIDSDEGLISKRRLLTIVSIILLAVEFSGARIIEANTFIVKLGFDNQSGLSVLLLVSIIFLMIRYYNYAERYHQELYDLWTTQLLNDPTIHQVCPHSDNSSGWLYEAKPDRIKLPNFFDDSVSYKFSYICKFPLRRIFGYHTSDEHDTHDEYVSIFNKLGLKIYLSVLWLEAKLRISSYFKNRENLDIQAPYFLAVCAILSFFFNHQLQLVLQWFTGF